MTERKVIIVDYGMGNLFSISRAVEFCGARPVLTGDAAVVRKADRAILPGVGAFGDGMAGIRESGLAEAVIELAAAGQPLLGICLGMQMLLDASEEFGEHAGLGLIAGRVVPIPATGTDGIAHKVPHIGWNALVETVPGRWSGTVLEGTGPGTSVYFVHSFAAEPTDATDVLATCDYGGHAVTAAVARDNVCGCQFHPERSGLMGLEILGHFLAQ